MRTYKLNLIATLLCLIGLSQMSLAQQEDKTYSPYFKIVSETNTTESLPLKSTTADVNILGVIADVKIEQKYQNTGTENIEAIYVFPASTKAAVYHMEMYVGDKVIQAVIHEKGKAKEKYEKAKAAGKRASLLEQDRPNIFTMNVANIAPGENISIVLKYTEKLIPVEGIYTFVYPTVVGPRFTGEQTTKQLAQNISLPYTNEGVKPLYEFDIDVQISAGMALQDVSCETHNTTISYNGLEEVNIGLDPSEAFGGDRDFVVDYQLAGKKINSGLMVYEGKEENHFMMTIQPPKRIQNSDIPQREYIFVVDVSGSMNGFPMQVSKKLMRNLIGGLRPNDKFNLMLFASTSTIYAEESVYADEREINSALKILDQRSGGGGTRLLSALNKAVAIPKCDEGLSRSIVIITDGYISVEREVFDLIKNNSEFNFYSFGIGRSVNRHLIEGIAHVGGGEPLVVKEQAEANEKAEAFRKFISTPVLTDIFVDWGEFDVYDLEPSSFKDLLAEKPVVISGKYRGKPNGLVELTGISGESIHRNVMDVNLIESSSKNKALSYLWARERIKILDDYIKLDKNEFNKKEVTELGLKYNLLTNYTSFVAVDEQSNLAQAKARKGKNNLKTVKQPLPLPKDVSAYAIGSTPVVAATENYGAELLIENHLPSFDVTPMKDALKLNPYNDASASITNERPSITFVVGDDEVNEAYFSHSKRFFLFDRSAKTDYFVDSCTSLLSIRNHLEQSLPEGQEAWGAVNVVCHSNQWTGMKVSLDGRSERTNLEALLESVANGQFKPLSNNVLDRHSLIDIKACGLGQNENLMAALQLAFGGNDQEVPGVRSSKNFVYFSQEEGAIELKSLKPYYAFYKTANRPANIHLAKQFSQRYPDADIDWLTAMQLREPRWEGDAFHTRFNVPVKWDLIFDKNAPELEVLKTKGELAFVKSQPALMSLLSKYEIPVDKFRWTISKEKVGKEVQVTIKGKSTVLCVMQEEEIFN